MSQTTAYRVLVADPPWLSRDRLPGPGRGAAKKYPCMPVSEICRFPLPPMEPDAILLLWRVAWAVEEANLVAKAWGFTPKSEIIWLKTTKHGKKHTGMGHYVRLSHEACMIAGRGKSASLRLRKDIRSTFEAPTGDHSDKPNAFYELVESLYPGPYVELFARRHREGWQQYGNGLPGGKSHP